MSELRPQLYDSVIKLWLEVYDSGTTLDGVEIPVTQVTMNFIVNSVPEVTCSLAVGTDTRRKTASPTHQLVEIAEHRLKIKLMIEGRGRMGRDKRDRTRLWPTGTYELWRGVTIGVGHTMTNGKISFTLNCAHWILDLDSGSMASEDIVRGSIDNMLATASADIEGATGELTEHTLAGIVFEKRGTGPVDAWENIMLPLFAALMQRADASTDGQLSATSTYTDLINKMKLFPNAAISEDAAKDFTGIHLGNAPALTILQEDFNKATEIIPGKLTIKDYENAVLDLEFTLAMTRIMVSNLGSMSALNKLLTAAQEFSFALVTNSQSATCIPYTPVFKNEQIWRELKPADYLNVYGRGFTPTKLAGVGMLSLQPFEFHLEGGEPSESQYGELAGMYLGRAEGKFKLVKAPSWTQIQLSEDFAKQELERQGELEALTEEERLSFRHAGCDFAHTYWADEAFKGRTTQIRIPFRLDIGIGCPIKLNGMSLATGEGVSSRTNSILYGSVAAVRVVISSEPAGAATELVVTHLRSEAENKYAPDFHPLYQNVWPGSPLVKLGEEDLVPVGSGFE